VLKKQVDSNNGDNSKVQMKVDMAMQSISLVKQEQIQVAKSLRLQTRGAATSQLDIGVMGSGTSTRSASSVGQHQPPAQLPSDSLLHHHQVGLDHVQWKPMAP
jgi:hypothetical protein